MAQDITALATQIIQLSKRLQDAEARIQALNGSLIAFEKLGEHAATCQPESVKSELQSLKADVLDLAKKFEAMREGLATGHGMQQRTTLSKEDYANSLEARLAEASLGEVVEVIEGGN